MSSYVQEPLSVSTARPAAASAALERHGFAYLGERELGLRVGGFRRHLLNDYFNGGALRSDLPDIPPDRERARDVVYYHWQPAEAAAPRGELIRLVGNLQTAILDRDSRPGPRDYARVPFVTNPCAATWVAAILALLPVETRSRAGGRGTFGVNLFRTHTQVVTRPHHDDEEYVVVYVVDKVGGGAETQLYDAKTGEVVHSAVLEPGELVIFKDEAFLHNVTPLVPPPDGGGAHRDALVCTVNYPWSYPLDRDLWTSPSGPASRIVPGPRESATAPALRARPPR